MSLSESSKTTILNSENKEISLSKKEENKNNLVPTKNGKIDRTQYDKNELATFDNINNNIKVNDSNSILNYGLELQSKLANYSDEFLNNIKAFDAGEIGHTINDLLSQINHVDVENSDNKFKKMMLKLPFAKKVMTSGKRLLQKYDSINNNIGDIVTSLDKGRLNILKDNDKLKTLFENNVSYIEELEQHIIAGHLKLEELQDELNEMRDSGDYESYEISDREDFINRLSKRVMDMELTRTITVQTLPQIRLVQNNNATMAEKVQSSITTTIPIWKNQVSVAVALNRQKGIIEVQNKVYDTTNKILSKNSEMLKTNSVDVAKQNERGVVDIDTIKKVNQDLVSTLSEIKKIKEDGDKARKEVQKQLSIVETELKETIVKNNG